MLGTLQGQAVPVRDIGTTSTAPTPSEEVEPLFFGGTGRSACGTGAAGIWLAGATETAAFAITGGEPTFAVGTLGRTPVAAFAGDSTGAIPGAEASGLTAEGPAGLSAAPAVVAAAIGFAPALDDGCPDICR